MGLIKTRPMTDQRSKNRDPHVVGLPPNLPYGCGPVKQAALDRNISNAGPFYSGLSFSKAQSGLTGLTHDFNTGALTLDDITKKDIIGADTEKELMPTECFFPSQSGPSLRNRHRFRRAISAPIPERPSLLKLGGKLQKLKPKTMEDFTKGTISSWVDVEFAKREVYQKKIKINSTLNVSTATGKNDAKRNLLHSKELKVYSRDRTRLCPKKAIIPEMESNMGDEFNKVLELEDEGVKQNFFGLDSSDSSSSSDSEAIYISDDAIEEDVEAQLEGISSLFEDHEPTPVREKEVERVCGKLKEVSSSPKIKGSFAVKQLQWKEVQIFLSNMGIQIIRDNSTNNSEVKSIDDKKKRGCRELQRLKFNVNYDHGSCSRGKNISL